jgi:hypothetical protein
MRDSVHFLLPACFIEQAIWQSLHPVHLSGLMESDLVSIIFITSFC